MTDKIFIRSSASPRSFPPWLLIRSKQQAASSTMDRIRDLASRQRASLVSLSSSHSSRKANHKNTKSTTNFKSNSSESIQPSQSSQATAKAQESPSSSTDTGEAKKKKNKKKINSKAAKRRASMERRESDQKLMDMAQAVIDQNEVLFERDHELSLRLTVAACDILEANKCIERKDQEIAEINKKLEDMKEKFVEAKKLVEKAQLLASQASDRGIAGQSNIDIVTRWHEAVSAMVNEMEVSDIAAWTKEKTHLFLKVRSSLFSIHSLFHTPFRSHTATRRNIDTQTMSCHCVLC